MYFNRMTRRMFLRGLGGASLAIPLLPSLLPRSAWGQAATARKRYVYMFSSYDLGYHASWLPNPSGEFVKVPQPRIVGSGLRYQPLRDFATSNSVPLARLYGTTLNSVLEYVNIIRSLDFTTRYGHGYGFANGFGIDNEGSTGLTEIQTFDNFMMKHVGINPSKKYLICGSSQLGYKITSRDEAGASATMIGSISELYNTIFSSGRFPESGGSSGGGVSNSTTTITPPDPRLATMNLVLEDYKRTLNSRNISSADKVNLNNVMDLFSDIAKGLPQGGATTIIKPDNLPTGACQYKNISPGGTGISGAMKSASSGQLIANIIAAAIMCDAAQVFSLNFDVGDFHSNNVSHNPGTNNNWKTMADANSVLIKNVFAPLAVKLAGAIDPANGKSYLYNSLLHATYEHSEFHGWASHPAILAGNAGGGFSSGNYIDYADRAKGKINTLDPSWAASGSDVPASDSDNYYGVAYNRLLVTIAQAFGAKPADYENNALNTRFGYSNMGGWGYASVNRLSADIAKYSPTEFKNKLTLPPG